MQQIERQLAIILPCMNDDLDILQGVLGGIPHHCLVIVISNSIADNYKSERAMLIDFCRRCARRSLIVHQTNPDFAGAFEAAGLPRILHHDTGIRGGARRIRSGKGEAMVVGTILAKVEGKRFVSLMDADNFVSGAVHEYCKVFATGLYHAFDDVDSLHSGADTGE